MVTPKNLDSPVTREFFPVTLTILPRDIREMEYYLNEAPMAYPAAKNALVFALRRVLNARAGRVLVQVNEEGCATARIGRRSYPLGEELGQWLNRALRGWKMEPITEIVWLPGKLLDSPIRVKRER